MFKDKNGIEIGVGDYIIPDEGRELLLVSVAYVPDYGEECLFGQQILDPFAFSLLTQENLSTRWAKTEQPTQTYILENLKSGTVVETDGAKATDEESHAEEVEETKVDDKETIREDHSNARKVEINGK